MANDRLFRYRTSLDGDEEVKRKLAAIGQAGDAGLKPLEPRLDQVRQKLTALGRDADTSSARMIQGMSNVNIANQRLLAGMTAAGQQAAAMNAQIANANRMQAAAIPITRGYGMAIQQAGFQVGDFAVQVASGSGVLRPFIQQGTQLISMFGPWGAVIGAAGAIVGALAMTMTDLGDSTKDAGDEADETATRIGKLSGIMEKLRGQAELTREALQFSASGIVGMSRLELENEINQLARSLGPAPDPSQPGAARLAASRAAREAQSGAQETIKRIKELRGELAVLRAEAGEFDDRFSVNWRQSADAIELVRDKEEELRREQERLGEQAAREAEREQERRAQARDAIERQIDALLREAGQIEMTARARAIDLEIQKAEETARRGNIVLIDTEIERLREAAGVRFDNAAAAKAAAEAERERQRDIERLQRDAERGARDMQRPFEIATEGIQRTFADAFTEIFSDPVEAAEDLAETLKRIFAKLGGELAAALVITPLLSTEGGRLANLFDGERP